MDEYFESEVGKREAELFIQQMEQGLVGIDYDIIHNPDGSITMIKLEEEDNMTKEEAILFVQATEDHISAIALMAQVMDIMSSPKEVVNFCKALTEMAESGSTVEEMITGLRTDVINQMGGAEDRADKFLKERFLHAIGASSPRRARKDNVLALYNGFGCDEWVQMVYPEGLHSDEVSESEDIPLVEKHFHSGSDETPEDDEDEELSDEMDIPDELPPIYVLLNDKTPLKFGDKCVAFEFVTDNMIVFSDAESCGLGLIPVNNIMYIMPKPIYEASRAETEEYLKKAVDEFKGLFGEIYGE